VKAPTDTIDLLRSTLQTGVVSGAVETAASNYARLCQECSTRLERIAAMLEKGSDYQALQAAEEEPPLLDLIGALSFGSEKAWLDFCQAHQLPIAPKLDAKTVQALDRLYAQGVTANHPLYKDFRAAVLSREDDKALRIIRTIHKVNPGDENARSELQRLENKQWQDMLDQLRAALKTDDEERIATLAEKITSSVPADKRTAAPELTQAEGIRRALRRRQAGEKIPALLDDAAQHRDAGDWQSAALACDIIQELIETHDLDLTASQKSALEDAASYARRERTAAERQRAFARTLNSFTAFAQEAGTRLMTGSPPGLNEAAALDENFIRRWRELENFSLPVADDVLARLRQTGQSIRAALESAQRGRRTRAMLSAAALIAFLLGIGALTWHGWQARAYALDLASYRARQLAEPAAKLASSLKQEHPSLLRWPYLKSKIDETEAWVSQARDLAAHSDQSLAQLESAAAQNFTGMKPTEVLKRIDDAHAEIGQLPGDLAATASQRVTSLKTKAELMLANLGETRSTDVRRRLEEVNALLKSGLSYEHPASEVATAVQKLDTQLAELETWAKPEAATLQLPADLQAQIKSARQRIEDFKAELTRFDELRESTVSAASLTDFGKALAKWQDIRFAEAAPAASTVTALPTEEQFLANLMTGGDLTLWKAAVEDSSGQMMHPEAPQDSDLKVLLALRDDRHLNGVWENIVVDHSTGRGKRSVWSQGPLSESRIGDSQRRWSGKAFDPHPQDTGAAFINQDYKRLVIGGGSEQGQSVTSSKPAAVSALIQNLQLDRMTDANGERFERSLLSVMDRLMADVSTPAIAKAYVMLELERLTRERPFTWGMHLVPTLRADLAELHRLVGDHPLRSEDWMIPKVSTSLGSMLEKFFQTRQGRLYEKEAQARRLLVTRVSTTGVKFGGYVETDRALHLNTSARAAKELWLLGKSGPLLIATDAKTAPADALPLSPVLFLPLDRQQLLETYSTSISGVSSDKAEPTTSESPFLKP
jgi:exonuclease VII small subunit